MTLRQIIADMRELADQIAAAGINGFGNSVTDLADALESALAQEGEADLNQCDGCVAKTPVVAGLHVDPRGRGYMACQRDRYARPAAPVAQDESDARRLLLRLQPFLDSIICYASTMSEYEGNALHAELTAYFASAPTPDGEAKK